MEPTLFVGVHGAAVHELQRLLNRNLRPNPHLTPDGKFGGLTRAAVRRYQSSKWLEIDGIVGRCTWVALRGAERYVCLHRIRLVPQWTTSTCWSAATAMLLGRQACMSPGSAQLGRSGGLLNDSDLADPVNTRRFARSYGLTMLPGRSWLPDGLANLLAKRPLMMNTLWDADSYVQGRGSSGHMRILAGIRGDGSPGGSTIRIHDPWPPHRGRIYSKTYGPFMEGTPAATYQLFYR